MQHVGTLTPSIQCSRKSIAHMQHVGTMKPSGVSDWESLAQRRKIARICALYKAYTGDWAWMAIGDRLQAPNYLSRIDHHWKIRARKQRQT
jgi:hypothetical protein